MVVSHAVSESSDEPALQRCLARALAACTHKEGSSLDKSSGENLGFRPPDLWCQIYGGPGSLSQDFKI